jgi:hypothetical protein
MHRLRSASRPCAQVAQLVEQRIENPRVGSSILSLGTIRILPVYAFSQVFDVRWNPFRVVSR